jgi:predicted nucleic acid-binding protein
VKAIDTTVLIDHARGSEQAHEVVRRLRASGGIATTEFNAYELLSGVYSRPRAEARTRAVQFDRFLQRLTVLPFGRAAAHRAARIYCDLAERGESVDDVDLLIAATCLTAGVDTMVTRNRKHFERIPGLRVETY